MPRSQPTSHAHRSVCVCVRALDLNVNVKACIPQTTEALLTRENVCRKCGVPLSQALHVLDLDEEGGGRSRMDERTGPGGRGGGYAGYRGPGLVTTPTSQARILQVVRGCVSL